MFRKIMVPLDGTTFAEAAVTPAARLARQHGAELHLVFVNTSNNTGRDSHFLDLDAADYQDGRLKFLADTVGAELDIRVVTAESRGAIVGVLAEYGVSERADLIVMATHGRTGLRRAMVGSFADDLLHAVHIPVLLVRAGEHGASHHGVFSRVLVGLDGSTDGEEALDAAAAIAKAAQATLILAQVVVPIPVDVNLAVTAGVVITDPEATQQLVDEANARLERLAADIRTRDGIEVDMIVDTGTAVSTISVAAAEITRLAIERKVDLVVLTTRERRGSRLLLRSVADRILHETHCALLLCHATQAAVGRHAVNAPFSFERSD